MYKECVAPDVQIKLAVIDSGIDPSHPGVGEVAGGVRIQISDLGERIYSDDCTDCAGHCTACAGIIRQKVPDVSIYSVRIFDVSLMADGRSLVAAIQWCIDNKMNVVNLSLGTTDVTFKDTLREICRKAFGANVILVAAESNDGQESYPAVFEEVLGVTGGPIYEPDGFYYRANQPVECVARGNEQPVCWLDGKRIMAAGTSFAAPHITAIVAGLLKANPKSSIQDIRYLLITKALKEQTNSHITSLQAHPGSLDLVQDDYSWIKKAALYPYNKEMHSLVRYRDLLGFQLAGVGDPAGKGMVGKDAGEVIDEETVHLRIRPNIRQIIKGADTLILGYVDQLARIRERDLLREYVEMALDEGCHVFCFQELERGVYPGLYDLADKKGLHIAYPHIQPEEVVQAVRNSKSLPSVDVPVLSVMGASSQQGKFTLQLALRRMLIREGYRVG